jgi:hypothetical protein
MSDSPGSALNQSSAQKTGTDAISIDPASDEWPAGEGRDNSQALVLAWSGSSKTDLDRMFENARALAQAGDENAAEQDVRHVWNGYKAIVGTTHEDTSKAAYRLATLYAEKGAMPSAYEVMDETTKISRRRAGC